MYKKKAVVGTSAVVAVCGGCGGDAGGGGSDTAEAKPEAGVTAEDCGRDGGGTAVDFAGTLTRRLQWGHSTLSRALLSSTEMVWVHQGQSKWIAIPSIQSHCAMRRKACRTANGDDASVIINADHSIM